MDLAEEEAERVADLEQPQRGPRHARLHGPAPQAIRARPHPPLASTLPSLCQPSKLARVRQGVEHAY